VRISKSDKRGLAVRMVLMFACVLGVFAQERPKSDYYKKWLDQDVLWIISQEERDVFLKLQNDEERDSFIEQFWARRDPDPNTLENEFKIEHYRRILYANERFSAGIAGWKSDRGMIYIKFGEPDRIETYPAGGQYERLRKEGGGATSIFPMERWEYRRIEGVGEDIELEFVDDKGGGLYELTFDPQRKDALLLSGLMGLTWDEEEQLQMTGTTNKQDRISRRRYSGDLKGVYAGAGGFETARDKPFAKLELSGAVNRAPTIKYKDLEAAVSARITYSMFPFDVQAAFVRLTDQQVMVPVTLLLANDQLTWKRIEGLCFARAEVFGRVVGLSNRVEAVFEDEVAREFGEDRCEKARTRSSVYQKRLILKPGLYKLEIAVRDPESKRIGTLERRLEVPQYGEGQLKLSSIILADRIESGGRDQATSSFTLGDLRVVPKADDAFAASGNLGVYLQVYNFAVDQQSGRPGLQVEYALAAKGTEPGSWRDVSPAVMFAGQYCRLARMVSLSRLKPGDYELRVRVRDNISGQTSTATAPFRITS